MNSSRIPGFDLIHCSTQPSQSVWGRDQSPSSGGTADKVQGAPPERPDSAAQAGVPALPGHDEAENAGKPGRKSPETGSGKNLCHVFQKLDENWKW